MQRPGELRTVAALALLAASLRVATALGLGVIMSDGPVYLRLAKEMAAGEWGRALAHDYHPLYPLLTALLHPLARDWVTAGCAVSVLAGTAGVVILWALLRDAFDRRAAWIGAALLAIHPYAVDFSSDVQSDGLYHALFLGAAALAWWMLTRGLVRHALAAGAVAGLAYLTRPEGVGVVLVAGGIGALRVAAGRWPWRRALPCLGALALGWTLVASPYLVALHELHGGWMLTRKKSVTAVARLDGSVVAEQPGEPGEERRGSNSLTPLLARVGPLAAAVSETADVAIQGFRFDFLLLALVGAWSVRGRPGLRAAFLVGLAASYLGLELGLQIASGYSSKRHTVPPLSPLLGYAALGVPVTGAWLARALRARAPAPGARWLARPAAPLALVGVLLLSWNLPRDLAPRRSGDVAVRRAAEWVRAHGGGAGGVASHRARVAFYANAPYVSLRDAPGGGQEAVLAYLRAAGAGFVILDDRDLAARRDWRAATQGLPVLHQVSARGHTAWVYEVP